MLQYIIGTCSLNYNNKAYTGSCVQFQECWLSKHFLLIFIKKTKKKN
jgi:hypothetical protein